MQWENYFLNKVLCYILKLDCWNNLQLDTQFAC
jgi:hypothetical protein